MQLDLRYKGQLIKPYKKIFNKISKDSITPFHKFITNLSKTNNLDWWFSTPASRYNLTSPFFHHYCSIVFLDSIFKSNSNYFNDIKVPIEILLDSLALYNVIKIFVKNNNLPIRLKYQRSFLDKLKFFLRNKFIIVHQIIYRLNQYLIFKFLFKNHKVTNLKNKKKIILIDKYIFPKFITKERYYNNLLKLTKPEIRNRIYFVPTIAMIKIKDIYGVYNQLSQSNQNYIFKESSYSLKNILFAISHCFRKKKIDIKDCYIKNLNIKNIIVEELNDNTIAFFSAVESFLTINFVETLKKNEINLSKIIDWFENQTVDKAWNYSFNKYYPNIKSLGYRGMAPASMLLSEKYTLNIESKMGFLPKTLGVIGKKYIKDANKYNELIKVEVSPAFRFNYLWDLINSKTIKNNNFLIALPIIIDESLNIIKKIKSLNFSNDFEDKVFYVKPHPTTPINIIESYIKTNNLNKFIVTTESTESLFSKIDVLIGGMSSISLEAICLNIPVIIIDNKSQLSYFTIPPEIPNHLYKICDSENEILQNFHKFIEKNNNVNIKDINLNKKILTNYFEPVNEGNITDFLL